MSSYRPYFESQRERSDRERDSGYDRRRAERRYGDEDFEREHFRDFRGRDPYASREWREPFDPEDPERGDFGRGRFEQFEDWERPRELASRSGYRRTGPSYGYGAGTSSFGRAYRGGSFGAQGSPFARGRYGQYGYGPYAGRGPKGYQRSDERLREEVCDRLTADSEIDASDIEVSVQNGEVTLEGTVCERRMKRDAEDCAESVAGVREVTNRIRVDARREAGEHRDESEEHEDVSGVSRFWRSAH
jgi:BON domain-containing protein